jgi:hypothetical protein
MTVVSVSLVSCVAVLANHRLKVRFDDGGLFEAKERMSHTCVVRWFSRIAPGCFGRSRNVHQVIFQGTYLLSLVQCGR